MRKLSKVQYGHMFAPKRVLIIEDDRSLETVFDRIIQTIAPGSQTMWFTSAEEALVHLRGQIADGGIIYDLIIADIFLNGEVSGLELWKFCQTMSTQTGVVITSSMPIDRFFLAIGQNTIAPPFLAKPFSVGECRNMLEGMFVYSETQNRKAA